MLYDGADPRLPSAFGETPLQISTLADAARGALPEDEALTAVVREALQPWHPERHGLFPRSFTPRVVTVLLLEQRLERMAAQQANQQQAGPEEATEHSSSSSAMLHVRLSKEEWLRVVPFLPRFRAPA